MKRKLMYLNLVIVLVFMIGFYNIYAKEEDVVEFELLFGEYNENLIKNISLDDGTTIGEYKYKIIDNRSKYLNPKYFEKKIFPTSVDGSIGRYFNYAGFITRSGKASLSLQPKNNVRSSEKTMLDAWSVLTNRNIGLGYDNRIKNNSSTLYNQYKCHYSFANSKKSWNLEHWRPDVGYFKTVLKGCNP